MSDVNDPTPDPASSPAPNPYPSAAPSPAPAGGQAPQNGLGTVALVMGLVQFVCLPLIASVLAIVFGWLGMKKAKQGLATNGGVAKAGFILGIVGLILSIIGAILFVVLVVFGVNAASEAIDPANNSRTGLADGNYTMEPNTSLRLNDRCSFGGTPVEFETGTAASSSVTVVGQGPTQCAGEGTPSVVYFTVTGGVAEIVGVE